MATGTDVRPMDDKHRKILRRCKEMLVKDMEPEDVLLKIVEPLLFTTEDENKIKSRDLTRQQQCEKLLEMLPRKGAKAYEIFKKTLEIVHPHLARTIIEAENKELNYEPRFERENSVHRRIFAYTKEMDTGTGPLATGRVEPSRPIQAEQGSFTEMDTGTKPLATGRVEPSRPIQAEQGSFTEMDNGTKPLATGRVEPSSPIQAEQGSFTVMDTGTRPPAVGLVEPSRSIHAEHIVDAVKQLQVVEANCRDVENRLKEKQEELQVSEATCKEVKRRLKEKQEDLKTLEAKSWDVEYRLERKQEELKTVERKYKDEENSLKQKQEELKTVEAKSRDVEYRLERKQEELKDVEGKCKDEKNRFKKKQKELKTVEAKVRDVEYRLERKQEELKDVERKCKDEENRFKEEQEAFNKSRDKHNCGKKSKYTKKTKRNTRASATVPLKLDTAGVTTKQNEQEQNSLLERITSFATLGLDLFPLTVDESLKKFCHYLSNSIHIHLTGKQVGSLILSVHCRTLEILEQLWQDYSSGHLDSVVKECFLTDETTIGLVTTISEKEYLRCKKFLTEISGKLSSQV